MRGIVIWKSHGTLPSNVRKRRAMAPQGMQRFAGLSWVMGMLSLASTFGFTFAQTRRAQHSGIIASMARVKRFLCTWAWRPQRQASPQWRASMRQRPWIVNQSVHQRLQLSQRILQPTHPSHQRHQWRRKKQQSSIHGKPTSGIPHEGRKNTPNQKMRAQNDDE